MFTAGIIEPVADFFSDFFYNLKDMLNPKIVIKDGDKFYDLSGKVLEETNYIEIQYQTPAPKISEKVLNNGKEATIKDDDSLNYANVLAYTTIPEIYKVGQENKIQIKWKNNGNQEMEFHAYDLNENGKLDYVEWVVPHLSEQTFEIIYITKALQLDKNKEIIEDIYDQVRYQDNAWAAIKNNQYIRFTSEKVLANQNSINLYAKANNCEDEFCNAKIEVYADNGKELIATFDSISQENIYKADIANLKEPTDSFELKILGDVAIDYLYGTAWKEVCDDKGICIYKSEKEGVNIEIGNIDRETENYEPSFKLSKWDGEISFQIKAPGFDGEEKDKIEWDGEPKIKSEKDSVSIESGTSEAKWYYIDEKETETADNSEKKDLSLLRRIDLGAIDPITMAASYEVFQKAEPSTPAVISYVPSQDAFIFYGYGLVDRDLYSSKINLPVTRYKTSQIHECPVIFANANGAIVTVLYHPSISQNPENFINLLEESIDEGLKKYNINIKRENHLLYYRDGLQHKQLGRIANDGNYIIFYLYLDSPLANDKFLEATRTFIALRDGIVFPIAGLREMNKDIDYSLSDEIIEIISKKLDTKIVADNFTQRETEIMNNLKPVLSSENWIKYSKRDDIKEPSQENSDKFEMEFILKEKPSTNVFNFDIETKGLNFYYQPELTEKEKDDGMFRPENVIGSYAVYYANQEKIYKTEAEGEKYKTGKAFHIYRPKIYDSAGNEVWGKMNIDKNKKILSITVSQDFLDKAVYPVIVDPTFGYNQIIGATSTSIRDYIAGSVFTGTVGSGKSITAYTSASGGGVAKYAIYTHDDLALVSNGTTAEVYTSTSAAWRTANFSAQPTLSAVNYIIAAWSDNGTKASLYYDSGDANQGHTQSLTYAANWPDPLVPTHNDNKYSIYVTYSEFSKWFKGNLWIKGNVKLK